MRRKKRRKKHNHKGISKYMQFFTIFSLLTLFGLAVSYSYFSETLTINLGANSLDYVIFGIPGRVEAENYINMNNVQSITSQDTDGTDCIGWIDSTSWTEYNVGVATTGYYNIEWRVADTNSSSSFDFLMDNITMGSYTVPDTGGWYTWTSVNTTSAIYLESGSHTMRLNYTGDDFSLNWAEFTEVTITIPDNVADGDPIEAEDYDVLNGTGTTTADDGTPAIVFDDSGDYIEFELYVPTTGSYNFDFRYATSETRARLRVFVDGTLIINKRLPTTGSMTVYDNWDSNQTLSAGTHTIRLYSQRDNDFNLNYFTVTPN